MEMLITLPCLLITVTSLLYTTNSVLYCVVPDDHHPTNSSCNTLRHYLNKSEKYFTSHFELQFSPGKHYLLKSLIVNDVYNLSLYGNVNKGKNYAIIYCSSSAYIAFRNSKHINITNLTIKNCGYSYSKFQYFTNSLSSLFLFNCSDIVVQNSVFECNYQQCGLVVFDAMGNSNINNIKSGQLLLVHNHTTSNVTTEISYYEQYGCCTNDSAIKIIIYQHSYKIKISFSYIKLNLHQPIQIYCSDCEGQNDITIKAMKLVGMIFSHHIIKITLKKCDGTYGKQYDNQMANTIQFVDCHFSSIISSAAVFMVQADQLVTLSRYSVVSILNSSFTKIKATSILQIHLTNVISSSWKPNLRSVIQNTTLSVINSSNAVILLEGANLLLNGPLLFHKIVSHVIILPINSRIHFKNHIQFSYNKMHYCIVIHYIIIEATILDIIGNNFSVFFYTVSGYGKLLHEIDNIRCLFQYVKSHQNYPASRKVQQPHYEILVKDNIGGFMYNRKFATSHCDWTGISTFMYLDPHEINHQIITYINNSIGIMENINTICYCTDDQNYNCTVDEIGSVYPGQTYTLNFIVSNTVKVESAVIVSIDGGPNRACKSHNIVERIQLFRNNCTKINYNVHYNKNGKTCEIYLSGVVMTTLKQIKAVSSQPFYDAYRVKILPCPVGFVFNEVTKMCQCDPLLQIAISCNIDDQTVVRPANTWVKVKQHGYQVSLQCPFDYCLPHSSHLNLSNPDSQCQFHRIGLLCGRCKEDLSTVFGTSQCKHCTNYYLFLLLPFTLAGIVLIVFLFISNFTVAEGNINGLIFYANIVSINGPVLFSDYTATKYVYILTSLLNLDLGIETCFYNGMDDYAKVWLQLIFPIYLIFIATLLIITSRYSTRIQRLTAHRALPVLATLFLLSYTKILRTVSSVLFSYSTITSLPNRTTTLVWSINTETKLFGLKFSFLFVVCLVLFLILLPFNVVLIFTRTLSRFKLINHFKPILDAFQGPYKDRFYYWTGIQLLLRAVFYGIVTLDRNTNMMIGIIILGAMECLYGTKFPFKSKLKNHQELFLLFNIQILFVSSMYTTSNSTAVNTLVGLALIQFTSFTFFQLVLHRTLKNISLVVLVRNYFAKHFNFIQPVPSITQQDIELSNAIPEVQYNYKAFQEPLIGCDK